MRLCARVKGPLTDTWVWSPGLRSGYCLEWYQCLLWGHKVWVMTVCVHIIQHGHHLWHIFLVQPQNVLTGVAVVLLSSVYSCFFHHAALFKSLAVPQLCPSSLTALFSIGSWGWIAVKCTWPLPCTFVDVRFVWPEGRTCVSCARLAHGCLPGTLGSRESTTDDTLPVDARLDLQHLAKQKDFSSLLKL